MPIESKKEIELEIAHVLFIDIVAYSKMAIDDQRATIEKLNQIVQSTDEYRKAEAESRLLKIATGDANGRANVADAGIKIATMEGDKICPPKDGFAVANIPSNRRHRFDSIECAPIDVARRAEIIAGGAKH